MGSMENYLVLTLVFGFAFSGVDSDFFVVLLEGSEIFTSMGKFAFLHTFSDVPVDEGSLCVHQVELVVESGEDFGDGGGVGDHAHGSHGCGKVSSWKIGWWFVVDTALETSWAPVDELDGSLGLDGVKR